MAWLGVLPPVCCVLCVLVLMLYDKTATETCQCAGLRCVAGTVAQADVNSGRHRYVWTGSMHCSTMYKCQDSCEQLLAAIA